MYFRVYKLPTIFKHVFRLYFKHFNIRMNMNIRIINIKNFVLLI